MRQWILFQALASLCWFALESHAGPSVAPGFLEGRLKVDVAGGARLADDESKAASVNYADYPMAVLRKADRAEIASVIADENGHYRIPLPPGDYLLELKGPLSQTSRDAAASLYGGFATDSARGHGASYRPLGERGSPLILTRRSQSSRDRQRRFSNLTPRHEISCWQTFVRPKDFLRPCREEDRAGITFRSF